MILEDIGCSIQPYDSYVAMAIWQLPPLLFSLGTLMFGSAKAFYSVISANLITVFQALLFTA